MFIYPESTSFDSGFDYDAFNVFKIVYLPDKHKLHSMTITVYRPPPKKKVLIIFSPRT